MRTHSLFSPSRLAMLQKCPSWIGKAELSSDAQRGCNLHEIITSSFLNGIVEHDDQTVNYALSKLAKIRREYPFCEWQAEPALDTGIPHVSGYADIIGLDSFDNLAIVIEIKTSYGERPEAASNIQVKAYSLALLRQVDVVNAFMLEADQRRVTGATWTRADMPIIHNEIIETIRASLQGGQYRAGGYCDYCSKQLICPEIQEALEGIQQLQIVIAEAKTLTAFEVSDRLGCYWEAMALVERYWNALKGRAMQIIEAGGKIEGFDVKVSAGTRKWTDEAAAMESLNKSGISVQELMTLQSPAAVEKILKASGLKIGEIKGMLSGLTTSSEKRTLIKNS